MRHQGHSQKIVQLKLNGGYCSHLMHKNQENMVYKCAYIQLQGRE